MNQPQSKTNTPIPPSQLLDLYDSLRDLTDHCFFICEAAEGMLSPELCPEPETINGFRLCADSLKERARILAGLVRDICEPRHLSSK